jgi:hypothetical protein
VINKQNDNFTGCVLPEYNFRINYPAVWQIVDNNSILYNNNMVVGFGIPKENPTDLSFDSLCIYVLDMPANYNISLSEFIDLNVHDLEDTRSEFNLIEVTPTTLGGVPAYQIVFTETGQKN